jgi:phosphatidylglycerophosphatase A
MKSIGLAIATVGGLGYFPFAPGTVGSAAGIVLYLLMRDATPAAHLAVFAIVCVVGVWASGVAGRALERDDPGPVIIDEVAGQLATLMLLDVGVVGALAGFFIFRALDIVKPWPADRLEALHGGLGVMADDVMAGAYGWVLMAILVTFVPGLR